MYVDVSSIGETMAVIDMGDRNPVSTYFCLVKELESDISDVLDGYRSMLSDVELDKNNDSLDSIYLYIDKVLMSAEKKIYSDGNTGLPHKEYKNIADSRINLFDVSSKGLITELKEKKYNFNDYYKLFHHFQTDMNDIMSGIITILYKDEYRHVIEEYARNDIFLEGKNDVEIHNLLNNTRNIYRENINKFIADATKRIDEDIEKINNITKEMMADCSKESDRYSEIIPGYV